MNCFITVPSTLERLGLSVTILGLLIAAFAFLSAVTTPHDMPGVQAIYYVVAVLGFILATLG